MKQLIAYIDILGFKNILHQEIVEAKKLLHQIYDMAELSNIISREKINFIAISDSVLFTQELEENISMGSARENLKSFINTISLFQRNAITHGILVRGGVTFGELEVYDIKVDGTKSSYSRNFLGDGFIRGIELESQAKFPRIIIDPSILTHSPFGYVDLKSFLKENERDVIFRPPSLVGCTSIEFEANDYPFIHYMGKTSIETYQHTAEEIGKVLTSHKIDRSTLEKVGWFAQYLKYCLIAQGGDQQKKEELLGKLGFLYL